MSQGSKNDNKEKTMYLTKKQSNLGIQLMDDAEAIPTGFMWYDYVDNINAFGTLHAKAEAFTKRDVKTLKQMKRHVDSSYNKFMKSIGEKR